MSQNRENRRNLFICLWIISFGLFVVCGGHSFYIGDDTFLYSTMNYSMGVMPGYQLFLLFARSIFRSRYLFTIIAIIQGMLASISLMCFTKYIYKICDLSVFTVMVVYVCGLIPFLVEFPDYITSQAILTEGLTIPSTYILIIMLLKALIEDNFWYIIVSYLVSMLLFFIRSQLVISTILVSFVMIWMILRRKKITFFRICVIGFGGIACACLIIWFVLKMYSGYITYLSPRLVVFDRTISKPAYENGINQMINDYFGEEPAQISTNDLASNNIDNSEKTLKNDNQISVLITIRGFFIAEDEDSELFEGEDKVLFQNIMSDLHAENVLWSDMKKTLFEPWEGMVQDKIASIVVGRIEANTHLDTNLLATATDMSIKIILHNIGDLIVVFLRLWFPALMAATFFQKPSIYVVCVVITFVINLFVIVCMWLRRNSSDSVDVMLRCSYLATIVYTVLVSVVYIPLQRYLIYFQGILYSSVFLVIRQMWFEKSIENSK